MLLLNEEEK
jgi:hypothetical protein